MTGAWFEEENIKYLLFLKKNLNKFEIKCRGK